MTSRRVSITALTLALFMPACGQSANPDSGGNGGDTGSSNAVTSAGDTNGGTSSDSGNIGGNGGFASSDSTGSTTGGIGTTDTGTTDTGSTGSSVTSSGGTTGTSATTGSSTTTSTGGTTGTTTTGTTGSTSSSTGTTGAMTPPLPELVTSAPNAYWKTDGSWTEVTSGNADVTVNDTATAQKWDGFGGAFNEIGWNVLTTTDMQNQAVKLLFSKTDGAAFAWGRIPIGASDYAVSRYTLDDTGTDVAPNSDGSNRPPADTSLSKFSLSRDGQKLIPYIKAAQAVNPGLRFWASPWTPPVWMKTGYKTDNGSGGTAKKPSYFDGGNMVNNAANLTAYAQYYTKFVQGYKDQGINIEAVSPQNEPGYDQNYPSCLWDKDTYTTWVGKYLGPAMQAIGVKVMLGTLSNVGDNNRNDLDIATAVLNDATAKSFLAVVGVQWGALDKVNSGTKFANLPVWATEHKCGNYPWNPQGYPAYNSTQAPNDQAYGVESWGYIRDAITKGKVNGYNAWNMVLDKTGLGNDTSRDWKQDALLVADSGKVNPTPAYYVFRHFSQYVVPGATVVGTSGGDAVAFKNPDGSIVVVMYNSGSARTYTVAVGGKKLQFSMPGNGWATVYYTP